VTVTTKGQNVEVVIGSGITLTFNQVTAAGDTTVTESGSPPSSYPPNPQSFKLVGTGRRSPTYYDIQTTAQYTGDITVCFNYNPRLFADIQNSLKLFHGSDNSWRSPIGNVDRAHRKVCANVSNLSPFVIGYEIYTFTGQPPINWEGTPSSFELADTIPFKFELIDASGHNVDSALAIIHVAKKDSSGAAIFEATPTGLSDTPHDIFRYSPTDQLYEYDLSTKDMSKFCEGI
jgi:hypothetical protein